VGPPPTPPPLLQDSRAGSPEGVDGNDGGGGYGDGSDVGGDGDGGGPQQGAGPVGEEWVARVTAAVEKAVRSQRFQDPNPTVFDVSTNTWRKGVLEITTKGIFKLWLHRRFRSNVALVKLPVQEVSVRAPPRRRPLSPSQPAPLAVAWARLSWCA
jgi:hypothetical protein